jgi:hypothetical protein
MAWIYKKNKKTKEIIESSILSPYLRKELIRDFQLQQGKVSSCKRE